MATKTRMQKRAEQAKQRRKEARDWLLELLLVLVIALLIRGFVLDLKRVSGPSMQETLHSGQVVLMDKLTPRFKAYSYGDIVVCRYPGGNDLYIKRIIGLPGDVIEICGGVTYRNGEAVKESYVTYAAVENLAACTVPEDCYFVMGDNRANSHDSRDEGAIPGSLLRGRVLCVCWPIQELHRVN